MAESYSVKAILSAKDSGFSSTLKSCSNLLGRIDNKISGFSFGLLTGAGQAAFSAITNSVTGLISEINASNAAWKTFEGNMRIVGKSDKEIQGVKKELQSFAEQTIYSSSDMASTYAQLEAVGVKSTLGLVKGFGGLAAAAENPKQAMKTLSQQGTQMAGKPTVAWADFKLMMEQTPAGMAAVAKAMGMTTSELVAKIQDGEVATKDFFAAVEEVGTSKSFTELATQYKTAGQAMGGLQETLSNKLTPAFEVLSQTSIGSLEGIIDKIAQIDAEGLAQKVATWLEKAEGYWNAFKDAFSGVGKELAEAFNAVKSSFTEINGEFGSAESVDNFKSLMQSVADVITGIANFATKHADKIATLIKYLPQIAIGIKAFSIAKTVAPYVTSFAGGIASLASKGLGGIAGKLFGVSKAQEVVGTTSKTSGTSMFACAKSFALMGVAVLAISAGFALLAQSAIALANAGGLAIGVMAGLVVGLAAIGLGMALVLKSLAPMGAQLMPAATAMLAMGAAVVLVSAGFAILAATSIQLANAGGLAIGVMVGMVAAVALLAVGAAALAPALTAGAVGLVAFGVAVVAVGAGALLAAAAVSVICGVLPTLVQYGLQGALAITALGASMAVFAVGAAAAGVASVALGVGLAAVAVGLTAAGVAAVVAAAGIVAMAAGTTLLGAAVLITAAGVTLLGGALPLAASGALSATAAFAALLAVSVGLTASMTLLNVPLVLIGASSLVAAAGMLVFAAGMVTGAAGTVLMTAALKAASSQMKSIASSAKTAQSSLTSMRQSVSVVENGLNALKSKAKGALDTLKNAFDDTARKAQTAGQNVGKNFANSMQSGLKSAVSNIKNTATQFKSAFTTVANTAKTAGLNTGKGFVSSLKSGLSSAKSTAQQAVTAVNTAFRNGRTNAYSAGAYISQGFAAGMASQLGYIQSAAAQMAAAADAAVRAKAQIHSPSRLTDKLGQYFGEGFVNGIAAMVRDAKHVAQELVTIPTVQTPKLATAYGYELSSDYEYSSNHAYTIEVPLTVDGKEMARATASYYQDELNRKQTRENRKKGVK